MDIKVITLIELFSNGLITVIVISFINDPLAIFDVSKDN